MSHEPDLDDARDAHLLAALRHAPDRDVRPPAQVTAAILGQANQAVGSSPMGRQTWHDGLRAALHRLWQPAPMAAFGTLAMATLIGVMWGAQNLPDATPGLRPAPAATPNADASVASGAMAEAPLPKAVQPGAPAREAVASGQRATSARPRPSANERPLANAAEATAPTSTAAAPVRQQALQETEARRDAATAVASPPADVPPAPPSVVLAPGPAPAPAEAMPRSASLQRDARAKSLADPATAGAPAPAPAAARARSEMATTALGAAALASAAPLVPAAAEINAAMNADAARVRWRIGAQRLAAHDAAQRDWWSALARATQGRWQLAATGSSSGAEGPTLALLIDGASRGSLAFEPLAVVWRDANGVAWRAPIAAETLREWQAALARW